MSEPTYTTSNLPTINETAVDIAAEITGVYRGMIEHWVEDTLNGAAPAPTGTLQHSAWIAYRAAALALSRSAHEATT